MTYTGLASKRYMSEVQNYKKITLGSTEELFLDLIAVRESSAYNIYSELNKGRGPKQKLEVDDFVSSHSQDRAMAYKNVHLRIKILCKLGLIEDTGEKQPRRAIKYRITTRGLFQCLLGYGIASPQVLLFSYKDNIILQTLLYEFFEVETVKELMSIFGDHFFDDYLKKCCEQTLTVVVDDVLSLADHKKNPEIEKKWPDYYPNIRLSHYGKHIDQVIKKELNNLYFEILTLSTNPNYEDKFPNSVISRDKKFLELLQNLEEMFHKGIKNLL
jgi:hypothetical protein